MSADPQLDVDIWNGVAPVGTPVRYWPGWRAGEPISSRTRSRATVLGDTAVVWVEGYASCIALSHVSLVSEGGAS